MTLFYVENIKIIEINMIYFMNMWDNKNRKR